MGTSEGWYCTGCEDSVDIMIAYSIGVFCNSCGSSVRIIKTDGEIEPIFDDYFTYPDDIIDPEDYGEL
jgi:hypothetical protein